MNEQGRSSDDTVRASGRKRATTTTEQQQQQQGAVAPHPTTTTTTSSTTSPLYPDDSFSDERFASLPAGSSWESSSQSFDSEARPSSRTSLRDRRKQFDLTTPTLIDEDYDSRNVGDDDDDDDDHEIVSLEQRHRTHTVDTDDSTLYDIRRTPGASMYKSSFDYSPDNIRRTPGASAMHRSGNPEQQQQDKESLGFGLTLSTPVASEDSSQQQHEQQQQREQSRLWEQRMTDAIGERKPSSLSAAAAAAASSEQKIRPPPAPSTAASLETSSSLTEVGTPTTTTESRLPFSFAPWTRATQSAAPSSLTEGRSGAFSPNTLRLREDLGNLLQDEDDDYALEIRSAFRGGGDDKSQYSEDWTGSYVFDSTTGSRRPSVPRNYFNNQKEGKQRRKMGNQGTTLLSHAQQPKPRRSSNEVFEFGKTARGDDRASPQLINFGGAFAPPASFTRPVASSASEVPTHQDPSLAPPGMQGLGAGRSAPMGFRPQTFMAYNQEAHLQPTGNFMQGNRFVPGIVDFVPPEGPPTISQSSSEMQATAREFVPMARSTPTPRAPPAPQHWSQPAPVTSQLEQPPSVDQHAWQHGNRFVPGYAYGAAGGPTFDPRAGMTPSPHLAGWQQSQQQQTQPDAKLYASVPSAAAASHVEQQQQQQQLSFARVVALTPTPSLHSQASTEASQPQQQRKRETKRGKRGKKKSQREKESSTSGKKTPVRRKGKGEGGTRPASTTQSQDGNADEGATSTAEDPVDTKRAELVESPATKSAFKDFYRTFRSEERISFQKAEEFAQQVIDSGSLPESVHWRVYLELADLAKRSNRFTEARQLYQRVCHLQPYAFQGWLEYSKLEEECGHLNRVMNILHAGLEYCEHNETLMTRAVKLQEKMGNLGTARALLARLKHVGIDKVWKTVLEGALMEARAGNVATARRVLKYLMHHVPWYGPLYLEAYRLERDQQRLDDALRVVELGLNAIPRYGPLWFGAFRLCEEMDLSGGKFALPTAINMIERATGSISKELVWKVHLEAAHMHERAALQQRALDHPMFHDLLEPARRRLALTVLTCPNSLRWKVWLAAARLELCIGNERRARALLQRAHSVVPDKGRSSTILEFARLEEFTGDVDLARAILCKGRLEYGHDWKVWLESVLLEIRDRRFARAIEICVGALEIHGGTGRLWACLVQLQQFGGGARTQNLALRRALNAVPKSGEVWCEGSRIRLNPFSYMFDLERARRHLFYATRFTPQYGDSFVEGIRLEIVHQWLVPIADYVWAETRSTFQPAKGDENNDCLTKYITDVTLAISVARQENEEVLKGLPRFSYHRIISTLRDRLKPESLKESTDLSDLRLACANADPNYGSLWFYCRRGASDPPRTVFEYASERMAEDVLAYAHIYLAAIIRRKAILSMNDLDSVPESLENKLETSDPRAVEWEDRVDEKLLADATLNEMFNPLDPTTGFVLLGDTVNGSLFVAGLTELNKDQKVASMTLAERKRAIYGNDALFP